MSRSTNKLILLSVAGLMAGVLAESAQAQLVINGAGSSAGRQFAGGAPIALCQAAPQPIHLRSGVDDSGSDRHTWICNAIVAGVNQPVVIRYSASESGDGFTKVSTQAGFSKTAPYIIDTSSCGTPATVTKSGLTFQEYSSCTQQVPETVDFGASDVQANSFGQTGPTGNSFPDPQTGGLLPPDQVAVLPFSLFVNNGVRLQTTAGGLGTQLDNLTRPQIEAIFRRNNRDWDELGYLVTSDGVNVDATKSGITLCLREAGSGSKAAFDQTQMLQSAEATVNNNTANGTGGSVIYSPTSSGVRTCVANNVNAIGYLNAETVVANAHPIQINGTLANYSSGSSFERKRDIACGRYDFWTTWVINRKTSYTPTAKNDLILAFIDSAKNETNNVPSGTHWVALSEMKVTKSADAGPISFLGGLNPPANLTCRP